MIIKKPGWNKQNKINHERQNKFPGNAVFCVDRHIIARLQAIINNDYTILLFSHWLKLISNAEADDPGIEDSGGTAVLGMIHPGDPAEGMGKIEDVERVDA